MLHLRVGAEELRMLEVAQERIRELEEKTGQLEYALKSRIVIEQAKGILAERLEIKVDEAFEILRHAARSHRLNLHELARRVVEETWTPGPVVVAMSKQQRFRAARMRELAEAHRATVAHLSQQLERVHHLDTPRRRPV